ncbi:MAG: nucleoside triphosphate pyrophosphohydrolase [Synergistaceae bacterium]|nr:nucleoside triphosphate pyrophosphohydrolase [Synergistaceae bacterium]
MSSDQHYFDEIVDIIERLRAPDGCPWDRKQTLETLRTPITEEAYELADAITKNKMDAVKEEAGDLLLQIVFVASLAREQGAFEMKDVVRAICDKLIRRHPHVFGTVDAKDSDEVLRNWERIKLEERREKQEDLSILAGVPDGLPPLLKANRLQGKAAHVGFDWARGDPEPLFAKLDEEIGEFKEAIGEGDARHMEEELGDVLFMTVNLARYFKIDPDAALSRVCEKFKARFQLMERMAAEEERNGGKPLSGRTLDEQGALWDRAKERLSGSGQPEESC